ncbi:MAG: YwiC-like family protein [Polyangiales bacterium]
MSHPTRPRPTDDFEGDAAPAMVPREHGAWGQLLTPLVTGLAMGHGTLDAAGFSLAAVLAFVAHEPLLVALGHRGGRAQTRFGALAWKRTVIRGGAALGVGVASCLHAPNDARLATLVALAMVVLSAPFVLTRRERTTAGETVLASTLASAAVPVAIAGGVSWHGALMAWGLWSLHGLLATLSVRGMIFRQRKTATMHLSVAGAVAGALALVAAAKLATQNPWLVLAMAPCGVLAVAFALRPVAPAHLRRVGWVLVVASLLTAVGIGLGAA